MTLPTPPKYVVVPAEAIDQAFATEKPRRALLASFIRILSLAWESKYQQTPRLKEDELIDFLKLSRRQYFEQKAEMESLGWLRSSHPVPGFVQFNFSRLVVETVSAENSTEVRKTALVLMNEDEESLIKLNTESSSSLNTAVRKIAPAIPVRKSAQPANPEAQTDAEKLMLALIENLPLLFDPKIYNGPLEMRPIWLAGIPEYAIGWITKAYKERDSLVKGGGPLGLIVNGLNSGKGPTSNWYLHNFTTILTDEYLEAVQLVDFACEFCSEKFATRALRESHCESVHSHHCDECGEDFTSIEALKDHWNAEHDPYRVRKTALTPEIPMPTLDGSIQTLWRAVLSRLQAEMPKASFETWVQSSAPVRCDRNVLAVGVRNTYTQDWLTNRLTARVNQLLAELAIDQSLTVEFITADVEAIYEH